MSIFEAQNLHKRFGDQVVLEDISLSFEAQGLAGIMGPNGAGKTTCFNVLTGRYKPDRGRVRFQGKDITGLPPRSIARLGIARSFQTMNLFDEYTALENVLIAVPEVRALGFHGLRDLGAESESIDKASEVLRRVGLAGLEYKPASSLSYGQRRALERRPDPGDPPGPDHRGDRARHALPLRPGGHHLGDPLGPGHRPGHARGAAHQQVGADLQPGGLGMRLQVERIETFYGETQALFGPSLEVGEGEVVSLLGPNGAGKTTTLRSILGLTPARAGAIRFDGQDITRKPTFEIAKSGIGWVPDDRRIFPTLTVARNLSIAKKRTGFRSWSEAEMFEIFTALEYLMERECENLSGGEMQMVAISRALLGSPGLVLFDEPSQGLAPKIVQDVMKTITRLKQEGLSVLVVEQNATSALQVSDRVYVMDLGRIVHEGPAAELMAQDELRTRLLGI
jgi:branched-chain amino acid transport system ATP-binding protein